MSRKRRQAAGLGRKRSSKVGLPPGTLVHVGERKTEEVRIRVVRYESQRAELLEPKDVKECRSLRVEGLTTWIDVQGVHRVEVVEDLGECFNLHGLLLEDVLDTNQRPKLEDYEGHTYLVLRALKYNGELSSVVSEQVSLVLSQGLVISFQEGDEDIFSAVRERLVAGRGRIRQMGADYLLYCLVDNVVDRYFFLLERLGEEIEALEEKVLSLPGPETAREVHRLRRELLLVRKAIWPLREVLGGLLRGESGLVGDSVRPFLRDVYDHTIEIIDTLETFRDMAAGMLDVYLSSVSNRLNEVMKFLTMISTIFIPLTFIAGVYGMNFKLMPELEWPWGYPAALGLMGCVGACMVWYFRKKGWL